MTPGDAVDNVTTRWLVVSTVPGFAAERVVAIVSAVWAPGAELRERKLEGHERGIWHGRRVAPGGSAR